MSACILTLGLGACGIEVDEAGEHVSMPATSEAPATIAPTTEAPTTTDPHAGDREVALRYAPWMADVADAMRVAGDSTTPAELLGHCLTIEDRLAERPDGGFDDDVLRGAMDGYVDAVGRMVDACIDFDPDALMLASAQSEVYLEQLTNRIEEIR